MKDYLKQMDPDAFPPGFIEHCQYMINSTLQFLHLREPEPPLPIFLSEHSIYSVRISNGKFNQCIERLTGPLGGSGGVYESIFVHWTEEDCYICDGKGCLRCEQCICQEIVGGRAGSGTDGLKLQHLWFPLIITAETKVFATFKN